MSHSSKATKQHQPTPTAGGHKFLEEVPEETYCKLCKADFANWKALYVHKYLSRKHIICSVCGFEFKTQKGYKRHHDQVHAHEQNLKCPACSEVFARVGAFMSHLELTKCPVLNKAKEAEKKEAAKKQNLGTFDQIREAGNWRALPEPNTNVPSALRATTSQRVGAAQSSPPSALQSPISSIVPRTTSKQPEHTTTDHLYPLQAPIVPKEAHTSRILDTKQRSVNPAEEEDLIDLTLNSGWGSDEIKNQHFPPLGSANPYKEPNILDKPIAFQQQNEVPLPKSLQATGSSLNQNLIKRWLVPMAYGNQSAAADQSNVSQLRKDGPSPALQSPSKLKLLDDEPVAITSNRLPDPFTVLKPTKSDQQVQAGAEKESWDKLIVEKPTTWAKELFPNATPAIAPPPQSWAQPVDDSFGGPTGTNSHDPDPSDFRAGQYYIQETNKFKCPHRGCPKSFGSRDGFIRHLKSPAHNKDLEMHQCRSCLRYFASATALTQHVESQAIRCHVRQQPNFDNYIDGLTRNIVALTGLHGDDTNAYEVQVLDTEGVKLKNETEERKKEKETTNKGDKYWQENADRIKW